MTESPAPAPAETAPPAAPARAPPVSRTIKEIKREQKKDGADQFFVVFEGAESEKGQWVPASEVPEDLVTAFRNKKRVKVAISGSQPRKIKEIKGMIPDDNNDFSFVVKFRDSAKYECVRRADMHKQYPQALLKYYEQNMERIPVAKPAESV